MYCQLLQGKHQIKSSLRYESIDTVLYTKYAYNLTNCQSKFKLGFFRSKCTYRKWGIRESRQKNVTDMTDITLGYH